MRILSLLFLCALLLFSFLSPESLTDRIRQELGVEVSQGSVLESTDTHGGFHGDGTTFIKLSVPGTVFASREESFAWKQFPLTDNLHSALYGDSLCLFEDEKGDPLLPYIKNGYYLFQDRHSQSTDPADDAELYSRASWNFTLSIYDTDTETLYYLRFDS